MIIERNVEHARTLDVSKPRLRLGAMSIVALTLVLCTLLSVATNSFFSYNNIYSILFGVSIQFFLPSLGLPI